jgi:hypothetical protein
LLTSNPKTELEEEEHRFILADWSPCGFFSQELASDLSTRLSDIVDLVRLDSPSDAHRPSLRFALLSLPLILLFFCTGGGCRLYGSSCQAVAIRQPDKHHGITNVRSGHTLEPC